MAEQDDKAPRPGRRLASATPMRQAVARRMCQSKQQAPHFYVTCEITMDSAIAATAALNDGKALNERVTLTALMLRAIALTLADHPDFNAHWTDRGHELIDAINLGVAIELPTGLIAPAILACGSLSVQEISTHLEDLVQRTRKGKLRATELNDATFTLSNLGMFDVSSFVAIVPPPQVAILATGRSQAVPWVVDGEIVVRHVMTATLSADHRAVDGAGAARFLGDLKRQLESC